MTFHRTFRTIAGVAAVAVATASVPPPRWRSPRAVRMAHGMAWADPTR